MEGQEDLHARQVYILTGEVKLQQEQTGDATDDRQHHAEGLSVSFPLPALALL